MKKYELSLQVGLIRYSDIGKEMTLRNANEHRRLEGRLKHLDLQLHNKMSAQHLASMGFVDFNTVIDKRLKQTQDELPTQEQMRQVRYLRWRDEEEEELDIVKAVFN
ncbi:hypothetical protein QZH41_006091 [Actinostola sp. cb2023]|nr:hypothetical protein QZH41_006091 [Actinostola sp. cb2023]